MESRAGFSDAMSLDLIGRIRDNRQIAMRLTFSGNPPPPGAMRFKAATYDVWQGRTWRRSGNSRTLRRNPREGRFRLADGARAAWAYPAMRAGAIWKATACSPPWWAAVWQVAKPPRLPTESVVPVVARC